MLRITFVLGICLVACFGAPSQDDSGRILNGKKAEKLKYPFQVSIQEKKMGYNLSKFCGGVIIDNSWILSAAHCFETYAGGKVKLNVYINAGVTEAYDRGANSQLVQVAQIFDHPNYDPQTVENDISLLKLETPLKYNQQVRPISLCPKGYDPTGTGDIIGWGAIDKHETVSSPELLWATTSVSTPEECKKFFTIKPTQICLGANVDNNACFGDSGGPFVQSVEGKTCVAGVTSYGDWGCEGHKPIVYTKVNSFLDFISDTMKNN